MTGNNDDSGDRPTQGKRSDEHDDPEQPPGDHDGPGQRSTGDETTGGRHHTEETTGGGDHTEETTDGEEGDAGGRRLLTRRRLLGAGAGVLGLLGGGSLYVYSELQAESVVYDAPEDFPTATTRGSFDEAGDPTDDGALTPTLDGSWPAADREQVVFVHGFSTPDDRARGQAYTTGRGLEETPLSLPTVAYSWDSDRDWEVAKSIAEANGVALARWLADRYDDGPGVHVLGYSLGARVVCEALQTLVADGTADVLASIGLLGGAIPNDSVERGNRYGDAIASSGTTVVNLHSGEDRVLGWIYRLSDGTQAVGSTGIRRPERAPESYHDVDVTDIVGDHLSYYEPGLGSLSRLAETVQQ